ncbi:hypothetical protein CROQUDRAFT_51760, partial [Cronartium quercuum f. sp. fusiforme G11]
PCTNLELKELMCKVNAASSAINDKQNNSPIQIKGASRLQSGDLLIHSHT